MTIETELLTLDATKTAIAAAIEGQGHDLTGKTFGEYAPEIVAIQSCTVPDLEAAWTNNATVVSGLLVADKQDPYDRVDPVQPGVVEAGDGAGIYRDTGVTPSATGFIEVKFVCPAISGNKALYGAYVSPNYFMSHITSSGTVISRVGDLSNASITSNIQLTEGGLYTLRVEYTTSSITQTINGVVTASASGIATAVPSIPIFLYGRNSNGSMNLPTDAKIIYVNLNDEHYYSASNMYYDQIGSSNAVAHGGTPIVTTYPDGDQSMDEVGYTDDNGTIIPASLTDPTLDAAGNPLEFAGRNAHSLQIISGSDMSDYVLQYVDDGPLDKYLSGSNLEDGLQNNYAGITETTTVIKFDTNELAVFSTPPTVSSILQAIL